MKSEKRFFARIAATTKFCVALALFFTFHFSLFTSCSTTRRLTDNETLYTGVRKMRIENSAADAKGKPAKVPPSVVTAVREPLAVKPNNPLFSPWMRTPLPVGLWAYNSFYTERTKGFRAWMYRTFARQPVLVERDVQPAARVGMVRDILDNHGYFGSSADFTLHPRGAKKSRISYGVRLAEPWFYGSVDFWADSLAATSNIKPGAQYNIDTLAREKTRIANLLRRRGYYFFRPEYVEYQADTTRAAHTVDLRARLAGGIPPAALKPYRVGDVSLEIFNARGRGEFREMNAGGVTVRYQQPRRLRRAVLRRALTLRPGEAARLPAINRAMNNLSELGVFRYVNLQVPDVDSLTPGAPLDLLFSAAMDTPMEATVEADLAYKSSSFLGPSLALGLTHNNIFRGGEVLGLKLNGAYEWQTGNTRAENSTAVNSYEIGLVGSLVFPRILAPGFIGRRLSKGSTGYSLGASLVNRPKFFRMVSFSGSNTYEFRTSRTVTHTLVPFKMVYNRLLSTTEGFDATMAENPAIAMSFDDRFIPSGSYTYTYDAPRGLDRLTFQAQLTTAGNVWGLLGAKKLFGQPLSQFFRETAEVRWFKSTGRTSQLAFRAFAGAGHAYGNSTVLPYTEQFYIGGANSIRAFTIRSIGPGGYVPSGDHRYRYFDQTGEMRLEANVEWRFRVTGPLNAAVFFDAGNIWLLHDDPTRPHGRIGQGAFWQQVATGTGVGVRYDLSFLVLRFDLGVGLHLPYDTGISSYYNIPRFRDGLGYHLAIGYPF